MRVLLGMATILTLATISGYASAQPLLLPMPPGQLVREVVYNELHDHQGHGFWRYWVERHSQKETRLENQVETADGPITQLVQSNGVALDASGREREQARIGRLLKSPDEQARHRQDYVEDEKRVGRILGMLPDAFLFEYAGDENGCHRLRFRPNPSYPAHSIEARVFHAMTGELWVSSSQKRLVRLDGHLEENVDFGFGILGRLRKGGWFRMQRTQVSATDWKTERFEVHMSGRAMLFKTIARETSEFRGGFVPVQAGMNLAQGASLLDQTNAASVEVKPARLVVRQ